MQPTDAFIRDVLSHWHLPEPSAVHELRPRAMARITFPNTSDSAERAFGSLLLKRAKDDSNQASERLAFEQEVVRHLDHHGVGVPVPLLTRDGRGAARCDGGLFTLVHWLDGDDVHPGSGQAAEMRRFHNCGAAIARMHQALAQFSRERSVGRTWTNDMAGDLRSRWCPAIAKHCSGDRFTRVKRFCDAFSDRFANLPMQLIHRDCHGANVVLCGERVVGFIDCDHISFGSPILDLAYYIMHMIWYCFEDTVAVTSWRQFYPRVVGGYESVRPLLPEERMALFAMVQACFLLFAGYFLEIGRPDLADVRIRGFEWSTAQCPAGLEAV